MAKPPAKNELLQNEVSSHSKLGGKTSITLSDNVLNEVDKIITSKGDRSTFIETAIQYYLKHRKKEIRNQNDLDIINKLSDSLNEEAEDILSYQVKI